ncbi:hypothetical protein SETIT_8G200100v2 [Setaria italica]|uniref:AAA+ ATPase domain-containing protein n=1 Tax=Setaria italica TaxID=4555 RepID=A0A368S9V8_SETIT|nr:hypothetical protein SETIT_8G200100v2 [Setaria italica]RCV39149.1 hypothetical protein SETIT_8G200100v2 [Setaria italica]
MEIVAGALPSLLPKLAELLTGEYNLQKEVKGGIIFLQAELESMQGALEKIAKTPADKLDDQDKVWASKMKEMSYDIEDTIDTYMVRCKGREPVEQHGFKKAIDKMLKWFRQPKIRRKIATEIREIKSRVIEVHERRRRYEVSLGVDKPVTVDPRLFAQYTEVKELVGIDEARDELINKIFIEENKVPLKQGRIVSIVGFGGLGKTTLANAVYKKIRAKFDCYAFVSVSQTPDLKKLYNSLLYDLGKSINEKTLGERQLIEVLREFLEDKRYFVVVDDVWDISVWKMIRCALPDNDVGYTIITTTRISHVAEQAGGAYNMKPLSLNNSRKLLYRRIFGNGNKDNNEDIVKCPDDELAEVSDRILKKCAGVPLAIITMASLLACKARNKMEWYGVYNSISTGLENNLNVDNMRKILSFSYYELPCHLRACLLYLSMFPEDYEIEKDHLIRMWIGEGFIQCDKAEKSLFELGESYFNELINRSMIQPIHNADDMISSMIKPIDDMIIHNADDMISSCRVHDMVLDLIRSMSCEENFVTVLSNMRGTSPSNTIRRLSLQNGQESHVMDQATWGLQHARSVVIFPASVSLMPSLDCCRVLRVLDLKDCNLSQANSILKCLGNIHQLRYLGLCETGISQLPEEIGNLKLLQTLDVRDNHISRLPSSVVQLRKLMCLYIDWYTSAPDGIGNLTCLEQLSVLRIDDSTRNIVEELGQLIELRRLSIELDKWNDKLWECLCKLQKMQNLFITVSADWMPGSPGQCSIGGSDAWAPRHLRVFCALDSCWFSTLPAWVNPSLLLDLTKLYIDVRELHQADLEILGRLPALRFLSLKWYFSRELCQGSESLCSVRFICGRQDELPTPMVFSTWA